MMNTLIIPIVFIILMIMFYLLRKNMHKIMKPGFRTLLLGFYLLFLLTGTIVFFIIQPKINPTNLPVENPPSLLDIVYENGDLNVLEPYIIDEWDIAVEEDTVRLQVHYTGQYMDTYIPVVVREDDDMQEEAHVLHYETPSVMNGIDISNYMLLPEVEVSDSLVAARVEDRVYEHDLHSVQNEAVLKQFAVDKEVGNLFDFGTGETLIVLTVPKGTVVTANVEQFDIIRR
ncbi:MAG TPA: hypothetical protein VFF20_09055 [Pseudogracilibacillus sp.]|nr:hypothetical protein [Pseudogracilibacillus sp.]